MRRALFRLAGIGRRHVGSRRRDTLERARPHREDGTPREPTLFFYHFRALNTGWKRPQIVVPADREKFVRDGRISAMERVVAGGDGAEIIGAFKAD